MVCSRRLVLSVLVVTLGTGLEDNLLANDFWQALRSWEGQFTGLLDIAQKKSEKEKQDMFHALRSAVTQVVVGTMAFSEHNALPVELSDSFLVDVVYPALLAGVADRLEKLSSEDGEKEETREYLLQRLRYALGAFPIAVALPGSNMELSYMTLLLAKFYCQMPHATVEAVRLRMAGSPVPEESAVPLLMLLAHAGDEDAKVRLEKLPEARIERWKYLFSHALKRHGPQGTP